MRDTLDAPNALADVSEPCAGASDALSVPCACVSLKCYHAKKVVTLRKPSPSPSRPRGRVVDQHVEAAHLVHGLVHGRLERRAVAKVDRGAAATSTHIPESGGICPNATQGSDHLPVRANIVIHPATDQ